MIALEAMQRLIAIADTHLSLTRSMAELGEMTQEQRLQVEESEVAVSIIQAMLNTALPIARFRCFVQVDVKSKRHGIIRDEYTICSPNIEGILSGLIGLNHTMTDVYATLWEQKAEGASMLSGFQGPSKTKRYRSWAESLMFFQPAVEEAAPDGAN